MTAQSLCSVCNAPLPPPAPRVSRQITCSPNCSRLAKAARERERYARQKAARNRPVATHCAYCNNPLPKAKSGGVLKYCRPNCRINAKRAREGRPPRYATPPAPTPDWQEEEDLIGWGPLKAELAQAFKHMEHR